MSLRDIETGVWCVVSAITIIGPPLSDTVSPKKVNLKNSSVFVLQNLCDEENEHGFFQQGCPTSNTERLHWLH